MIFLGCPVRVQVCILHSPSITCLYITQLRSHHCLMHSRYLLSHHCLALPICHTLAFRPHHQFVRSSDSVRVHFGAPRVHCRTHTKYGVSIIYELWREYGNWTDFGRNLCQNLRKAIWKAMKKQKYLPAGPSGGAFLRFLDIFVGIDQNVREIPLPVGMSWVIEYIWVINHRSSIIDHQGAGHIRAMEYDILYV